MQSVSFHLCLPMVHSPSWSICMCWLCHLLFSFPFSSRGNVQLPISVRPQVIIGDNHGTVNVQVTTRHITGDKPIEDIVVTIPFSASCTGTTLSSKFGIVHFDDVTKVCLHFFLWSDWCQVCRWTIRGIPANVHAPVLEGTFSFDPENKPSLPVISVDFKVQMWAASGIKVDSLTLLQEKYNHFKGVKSLTKGGQLQIRLS